MKVVNFAPKRDYLSPARKPALPMERVEATLASRYIGVALITHQHLLLLPVLDVLFNTGFWL